MDAASSSPRALLEANRRLLELRAQAAGPAAAREWPTPADPEWPAGQQAPGWSAGTLVHDPFPRAWLPDHLGWGSSALTAAVRRAAAGQSGDNSRPERESLPPERERLPAVAGNDSVSDNPRPPSSARLYPDLGLAALRANDVPAFRVWLTCHYLDRDGQGWLAVEQARASLTVESSPLRLCGWRRLRQILGQGNGRYWTWDKYRGRLWLYGAARVAAGSGVERLTGRPVALPVEALTGDTAAFKAHLYAAWHSGRKEANPISRATQQVLTGLPARTQRHYCRVAGVKRQHNIAIGGNYIPEAAQECAWRRGRALFEFCDAKGKQGRPGGRYLAWQLPATHSGPHERANRGRQRKVNRKLKDLVTKGARGNSSGKVSRMYWSDGWRVAGAGANRRAGVDTFWRHGYSRSERFQRWSVLAAP